MASPADPRFLRIPNLPDMQRPRCSPKLPLAFVRIRCLRQTRVTNWVRPGVFCDGNPLNLSQPIPRGLGSLIVRPAPLLWELVEIDQHGLPLDKEMRATMCAWFRTKYHAVVPEALLEPPAPPAAAGASADPPADVPPPDLDPVDRPAAAEPPPEPELPLAASANTAPAPAALPPTLSDNRARRRAQGGDLAGVRR